MRSIPKTLTKRQECAGELCRGDRAQALAASCCAKSKPKMRCPPINGTHPPCWSDTCGCRGRVFRTPAQDHTARRQRAERPEIRNVAAPLRPMLGRIIEKAVGRSRLYTKRRICRDA